MACRHERGRFLGEGGGKLYIYTGSEGKSGGFSWARAAVPGLSKFKSKSALVEHSTGKGLGSDKGALVRMAAAYKKVNPREPCGAQPSLEATWRGESGS